MKLRLALAAATCLALPVVAHAQPVTGPYVSLGAGTTILNPAPVNNQTASVEGKVLYKETYSGVFGAGYGFGDGFRVELSGDYFRNTAHKVDGNNGTQIPVTGAQITYGAMALVYYDIPVGLPIFPYVGAGGGYQWAKLNSDISGNFPVVGATTVAGTYGSFAYNIIGGVAYPVPMVPGLSLTAEYRFMQMTSVRKFRGMSGTPYFYPVSIGQESSHSFLFGARYQIFQPPAPPPPPAPAPVAAPAPAPAKTYLVFFDWDKYSLTPRALDIIAQAASDSKSQSTTTINVSGYTDTSGTPVYNMGLSQRRADAVAKQLIADGVPASEIETHAFGETHLLVPTGPGVREPQNRRVEIVLD
jgi:outer membrane protein OmpA-like peptidoglycan-associated protein/outer membrane protein W